MRANKNTRLKGRVGTAVKNASIPPIGAYCNVNHVKPIKGSIAMDKPKLHGYTKIKGAVSG